MSILVGATSGLAGAAGASAGGGDLGDTIAQSLRFKQTGTLRRNLQTEFPGSFSATATCSGWWKFANTISDTSARIIWRSDNLGGTDRGMQIKSDGTIQLRGSGGPHDLTGRYRDPSAWYHIVQQSDGTNLKCWINNNLVYNDTTPWGSGSNSFNENFDITCNNELGNEINYQLADFNFLDGTAADPDEFARLNDDGVWVPKTHSFTAAQYGANGFKLTFDSTQNATASVGIGIDSAPTGASGHTAANNFTSSNFDTTAISSSNEDNDIDYNDTPTNNYATLNSILSRSNGDFSGLNFEHANLRVQYGGGGSICGMAGFGIPGSSGKYYWEVTIKEQKEGGLGIVSEDFDLEDGNNSFGTDTANGGQAWEWILTEGRRDNNNTETNNSHTVPNVGDTIGFLLDTDAGTCTIEINGVAQTANNGAEFTNIPTDKTIYPYFRLGGASGDANLDWNFGQMDFQHEPSGYQHVATNSLSTPTIKNGKEHFGVLTYTAPASPSFPITIDGSGGNNGTGELKFGTKPDLVWIKMTNGTQNNILFDSIRGKTKSLRSDENIAENSTRSNFDFATDGVTFSSADAETYQQNDKYVAWCWKAGGTPTVDNDNAAGVAQDAGSVKVDGSDSSFAQGSIAVKKMSVNTTAGFSIVEYTGTGSAGTIPHGLGAVPEWAIFKRTDGPADWDCYHQGIGNTKVIKLNADSGQSADGIAYYNNTTPTSTLFHIGAGGANNTLNEEMIAYIWTPIVGYSKFGKYGGGRNTGTAPDMDGAYIETGFRPAFLLVKRVNADGDPWILLDSTRDPNNFAFRGQQPNNAVADPTSGDSYACDFLANGFKWRTANAGVNNASATYVYACFAENPFGGENAPPATAR